MLASGQSLQHPTEIIPLTYGDQTVLIFCISINDVKLAGIPKDPAASNWTVKHSKALNDRIGYV
jgi:ribosomal protein L24E